MNLIIKGFISISDNIANEPNKISKLGEIPTYCLTYSKEVGLYNREEYPNVKLYTLYSKDENGNDQELNSYIQREILAVYSRVDRYCKSNVKPIKKEELLLYLNNELKHEITGVGLGKMVDEGELTLPSWISWASYNYNYKCKIWFSSDVLLYDYDEYSITVIPPIEDLDKFFEGSSVVESELKKRTVTNMLELAQEAKDLHPETVTKMLTFDYHNKTSNVTLSTNWIVLIYGPAGDTLEAIKDAINDYCIENSSHDRGEWLDIFKELFSRTEFVLLPRYDLYSIPNLYVEEGMYKSMLDPLECISYCRSKIDFYEYDHIGQAIRIFPYDYKGIMICSVAGDTNIEGYQKLDEIYKDYLPVSSTSTDFMRMVEETREFCLVLETMLKICEDLDENTDIPKGYRRVKRNGKIYLTCTIGKVYYLMLSAKY